MSKGLLEFQWLLSFRQPDLEPRTPRLEKLEQVEKIKDYEMQDLRTQPPASSSCSEPGEISALRMNERCVLACTRFQVGLKGTKGTTAILRPPLYMDTQIGFTQTPFRRLLPQYSSLGRASGSHTAPETFGAVCQLGILCQCIGRFAQRFF